MAHHHSAKRRIRSDARKNLYNKQYLAGVRTHLSSFRSLAENCLLEKDADQSVLLAAFQKAQSCLGKASSKGLIHKNKASRLIGRLTRRLAYSTEHAGAGKDMQKYSN